jgi:hypothetical protein
MVLLLNSGGVLLLSSGGVLLENVNNSQSKQIRSVPLEDSQMGGMVRKMNKMNISGKNKPIKFLI